MASTTKGLFARGIGIDTTNYTTDGLFARGFQGEVTDIFPPNVILRRRSGGLIRIMRLASIIFLTLGV